jgi:hypothetical protein
MTAKDPRRHNEPQRANAPTCIDIGMAHSCTSFGQDELPPWLTDNPICYSWGSQGAGADVSYSDRFFCSFVR